MLDDTLRYLAIQAWLVMLVVLPSAASGQEPPLLEARGGEQQCRSLEAWTDEIKRLAGNDMSGKDVFTSQLRRGTNLFERVLPAFADSLFSRYVGKPYGELSNGDKRKILKAIQACMGYTFLETPFQTGRRGGRGTQRWEIAIAGVTEADLELANHEAERRAARAQAYQANRPQVVVRRIDIGSAARRKHKIETRSCHIQSSGWVYQRNKVIYDGFKAVERNENPAGRFDCTKKWNKGYVVPNVYSILSDRSSLTHGFVRGDMCAAEPQLLVLHSAPSVIYPEYGETFYTSPPFGSPYFDRIPYDYYVPSGSDGRNVRFNEIERILLATREIINKQCGEQPESIRVYGGTIAGKSPAQARAQSNVSLEFEYEEFYAGTFFPGALERRLVHDDAKMAETYSELADVRAGYVGGQRMAERQRHEDAVRGLGYLMLISLGMYSASPCHDPDIPNEDKPSDCY